ncbi:hypothetical protein MTR67_034072 [Solanum verrucosum]|uniref:Uncharacterized protein n=1 Tax=Solanum verrucosum TaxID=315347 RepID=A0AAF0U7F8_SOLVR|nr:hypothetical protein MTR67_034072 [Solanum verrucosum]
MNRKGKGKVKGKSNSQSEVKRPPWMELPEGIWANILHRLGAVEILETAEKVCKVMCRYAVDRSQGEVVDINLQYFATAQLLEYIAERSGKLKRLSIACCYGMVCESLVEVVQKLPLLEELSLTHTTITIEGIEDLGRSCPRLKLFELNNSLSMGSGDYFDNTQFLRVCRVRRTPLEGFFSYTRTLALMLGSSF